MAQLSIVPPDPAAHGEALFDFYAKVFSDWRFTDLSYFDAVALCRKAYFTNSHYDWQASRIGLLGDTLVSHFGVWGYEMRIGSARVRTGGIGSVATHGAFRQRGFMERTAQASLDAMRARDYDMTVLFGIDGFYQRFGYVRAWSETDFCVAAADLPAGGPTRPVRRFRPGERPDLVDLYNSCHAAHTGTAVRPTYLRPANFYAGAWLGYLWLAAAGSPAGYVVVRRRGNRLRCTEHCGDPEEALRVLGVLARRWHCPEVLFHTLPHRSGLCRLVRRGTHRRQTDYHRSGGPMVRVLNLAATLGKLTGELSRRLSESHLSGWCGDVQFTGGDERVTLRIVRGEVTVTPEGRTDHAVEGGPELAQLLLGTDEPGEVVEAGGLVLSGDAKRLLPVLFPAQHPQLSEADRY